MFAVLAAQEERSEDVLRGLRIALDKIRNYRRVHAIFDRFYSRTRLARAITEQRPLLLDPGNLRNNLLSSDVHGFLDQLASYANTTLRRLEISERCGRMLPDLFAPQPNVWSSLTQKPKEDSWMKSNRAS
jgi:hypothetical protein